MHIMYALGIRIIVIVIVVNNKQEEREKKRKGNKSRRCKPSRLASQTTNPVLARIVSPKSTKSRNETKPSQAENFPHPKFCISLSSSLPGHMIFPLHKAWI